jgi:dynein heavy chain
MWQQGVEENTHENLNKFLLFREATEIAVEGFVRVNFANELRAILREVKYLQLLDFPIPETALKLFAKVETYRVQTLRLQIIVDMYNNILATLLPVEKPLLAKKIENMGKSLQAGIDTLKWNSEGIDKFISVGHATVQEVDELVKKMKENVQKIHGFMDNWKDKVFFERRAKPMPPDELMSTHTAAVENRFEEVSNQGKEITKLLRDTESNIKPDKSSHEWRAYVDYVNGLVIAGITAGINASLLDLLKNININQSGMAQPIFDLKVNLQNRSV